MAEPEDTKAAPGAGGQEVAGRQRDAERTRAEILDIAGREFAGRGYAGARVDEIAAKTRTTKRMIYYYFTTKENLFVEVLVRAYAVVRAAEEQVDVAGLSPTAALRRVAELTFDHHESHPDFIRLVTIENIHAARHLATSPELSRLANPALDVLTRILRNGHEAGEFRGDVDALDIHMLISSFCVFRTANQHTFNAIFGRDMLDADRREHYREMLADVVLRYVKQQ